MIKFYVDVRIRVRSLTFALPFQKQVDADGLVSPDGRESTEKDSRRPGRYSEAPGRMRAFRSVQCLQILFCVKFPATTAVIALGLFVFRCIESVRHWVITHCFNLKVMVKRKSLLSRL